MVAVVAIKSSVAREMVCAGSVTAEIF